MDNKKIADFYDGFSERQYRTGANERLISLYKRLKKWGLKSDSNVLELGCGVGIFTRLMAKTVKSGKIEAVDLSTKSIEIAQKYVKNQNIDFCVGDVVNYQPKKNDFHFITLMDVIEHIPLENHNNLFENISKVSDEKTLLLINIPNPRYIEFVRKNNPETLQIIDQSVEFPDLTNTLNNNNLEIIFYEKYSIWQVEDYDFFVIRRKRDFQLLHLSNLRTLPQKISKKIRYTSDKIKHS